MKSLDQIYAESGRVEREVDRLNEARRSSYDNWMRKRPEPAHLVRIESYGRNSWPCVEGCDYKPIRFYKPICSCGWRTKGVTRHRHIAESQGAAHKALGVFGLQERP